MADISGLIAAVATCGLLIAAVIAGSIAYEQLQQLKVQLGLTKDQLQTLGEQLSTQRGTERRRRVFEHLGRLLDSDFVLMGTKAERLWRNRPSDPDGWRVLWHGTSDDDRALIQATMNFYEIVSGEYNDPSGELLDKALAEKALLPLTSAAWTEAEPFVRWMQSSQPRAYEEWEQAHDAFTRARSGESAAEKAWRHNG